MGSGKKKDKKKKKRERSSSEDDSYDDYDRAEKYSSKRKSETYVVEDVRPKTLQAIADNYSYEKSGKKKRSKYADVPETEEYVYDQFGEIVQTSRDMSVSPETSADEYDYKSKSSKYKELYERNLSQSNYTKRKGPVTPPPPSPPRSEKHKKVVKSQIKSSVVNSDVSSSQRKKEIIVIDDLLEYSKKKENRIDLISPNYTQSKNLENNYPLSDYSQKKVSPHPSKSEKYKSTYDQDKIETSSLKSQVKSSINYSDYVSTDYSQRIVPPPPPRQSPPPPPPPKPEKYKKGSYEQDILEPDYSKGKQETIAVKSILKKGNSDYISSDYSNKKDLHSNESNEQTVYNTPNYTQSKSSNGQDNYISQDFSQNKNYTNYDEGEKKKIDYNSAEYILKKIREQTKFKPSSNQSNEPKLDYTSSDYSQKNDSTEPSDYVSNYAAKGSTDVSYTTSIYNETKLTNKQTEYGTSEYVEKPSDYASTSYTEKRDTRELSDYTQNDSNLPSYSYDSGEQDNVSSSYPYESEYKSSGYRSQKDIYAGTDLNQTDDPYAYCDGDEYTYKKDSVKQDDYRNTQKKDSNITTEYESNDYSYKRDSNKHDDYVPSNYVRRDSREKDGYSGNSYAQESRERSLPPPVKQADNTPPLPPGGDWPFEEPEVSTYNDYPTRQKIEPVKNEPPPSTSSSSDSLSIEETNRLRAKLGLKPLNVDSGSSTTQEKPYSERDDVHAPATNISDKKSEEKMREKMEAIREKRKINKKLQKVKGLGEEDDPVLDSAAAWVAKSRIQEKEKAMAEKRAQMLEEMDEEFGVTKIMAKSILKKTSKYDEYEGRNLHGLKVEHRASDLAAVESTILTLKDKDVLDEEEDVLYNVNVRESEQARLNIKNKKKGPGYQAYDEYDEDTGEFKMRTVLDKYDEEIDGEQRDSFRINTDGTADTEGENHIDKIRAILKSQQVSLATGDLQLARDYFTSEEMVSFKKPGRKKVRKVRKREVLKADDLLKMELVDSQRDRGSRKLKSALKNSNKIQEEEDTSMDMDIAPTGVDELDYFVAANQHLEGDEPLFDDDEAEQELQLALQRSRRAKHKNTLQFGDENSSVEKVAKEVLKKPNMKDEDAELASNKLKKKTKGAIVLDSTSEFCRTLGDLPTLPITHLNESEQKSAEDMDIEEPETSTAVTTASGWEQVEITEAPKVVDAEEDDDDVLEAEPIPTGLAATLNLANMKGYLKDGKEKIRKFDPLNLPETKAEVDIEKLRDEEKNKYTRGYERERDRDRYDPYAWKEKQNYKPDIKLEYVDNKGRQMNQKEAFRLLSHKFHGKGSGKLKTEKRSKKLLDEKKLQMMSSIDTPLNTAALFKDKQKQSQSAYLVLSGGGKNILSGETLKK